MWKSLKNKIRLFLWKHSSKNTFMIPKGSVSTVELHYQTREFLEELKEYLNEDSLAFRKMQLGSYFGKKYIPDFNDTIPSLLYVCRLSSLFSFYYYIMYSLLIPVLEEKKINSLRILAFGCGSMIDALSLSYAQRDLGKNIDVHYTGVDIAKWSLIYTHPYENIFVQKPLQEFFEDKEEFDGNVIFFPTVLSEIPEIPDTIGQFCDSLERIKIISDTIFLMLCYRTTTTVLKDWRLTDWQKVQKIILTLEKKGFFGEHIPVTPPESWKTYLQCKMLKTDDDRSYPCYYISPPCGNKPLNEIAPDFAPSNEVTEYLNVPGNIRTTCQYYSMRRNQYFEKYKEVVPGKEKPETVCRQMCPIMCHPYPKVIMSQKTSPSFQIFVFHRK